MSATDRLNFADEKIFKVACENLPKPDGKTKNLIDCKDDIIFIWNDKKKCLLTQNVKAVNKNASVYQELHLTKPSLLDVHFIRLNESVKWAVLWGPGGFVVVEIPRRWGSCSGFQGGKSIIMVRSTTIDLRYNLLKDVKVQQIRFYAGSPRDDHLVVLTSDNNLRMYQLKVSESMDQSFDTVEVELVHVWTLGQSLEDGKTWNLGSGKVPFLVSLGELAVDFDFCLPVLNEEDKKLESENEVDDLIWPVIVLRGNGDVCYMTTSLTSKHKPRFEGPLPMYPPADDNYGVEACSVLVLPTVPSVVVVATSSGMIYHSVLLKTDQKEKICISDATQALFVMECVELELGITLNDDDSSYTCPIFLHPDPVCKWKYYATHNTGVHAVSVSFVHQIESYFDKSSTESVCFDQSSTAEYLVCTRTNATPILPMLGFTIITSTNIILSLLENGSVISLALKISEVLVNFDFPTDETINEEMTPIKKLLQEPFDLHIRNILKRNVSQPLIKLDKNVDLSPQELLDLITRTTNLFRQEYFTKFQLVRDETEQRVATLRALLALHMNELVDLEKEKIVLKAMAEKLAEKYEEIKDKQQVLNARIENMVNTVLRLEPIESLAEKKMKNKLIVVDERVEFFKKSIATLKKELNYQKFKIDAHKREKDKSIQLGGHQMETIKTNLNKTSQEIAELVKVVTAIKKQLNISE